VSKASTFRDVVERAILLAWKEDVSPLVNALCQEGILSIVNRADYSAEELCFSRASRTFLNHRDAWEKASQLPGYTLICESDFVPCRGLGYFPVFWPTCDDNAWGYLYQGSPCLLALMISNGRIFLRGHTAPLVAYVVNSTVAKVMLEFFEYEASRYDFREYFNFDAHLQWYIMGKGAKAFIPWRHYGEHGNLPNKEHPRLRKTSRSRTPSCR
jgi:hypothetical protein